MTCSATASGCNNVQKCSTTIRIDGTNQTCIQYSLFIGKKRGATQRQTTVTEALCCIFCAFPCPGSKHCDHVKGSLSVVEIFGKLRLHFETQRLDDISHCLSTCALMITWRLQQNALELISICLCYQKINSMLQKVQIIHSISFSAKGMPLGPQLVHRLWNGFFESIRPFKLTGRAKLRTVKFARRSNPPKMAQIKLGRLSGWN